jgi:hypothetical protein
MNSAPSESQPTAPAAVVAEQEALPPGTRFGELEIVRVLGVGGFGIVYLARDHALERDVAVKEYMPSALASRGQGPQITVRSAAFSETYAVGLRSFVNEARLLAKFDHPSLVKVYRFWEGNATAYMVMPYLQGRTLRDTRRGMAQPPDEAWIRGVIEPILGALEVLHRDGVFHRDIAPDNILLPLDGPPVLLDFGAARRVISDRTQTLTAILKPSYAPIEQYADMTALRQGPWTDLYALGAVVHFLLQGAPPPPATARAVHDEMTPLWTRNPQGVSPRFLAAIDWALAVRPQERPQSADALRAVFDGRAEPPMLARTVPGSTSLLPVGGTAGTGGYEPTQVSARPEPTFQPTVRAEPPAQVTVRTAAAPAPTAAATATTAAPVASPSSRKGLIGAALAVVAVLAGAAAWQAFEARREAAPAPSIAVTAPAPAVAATPVVPVPAPSTTPAVAAPAVAAAPEAAPSAPSDPAPSTAAPSPAGPALAARKPADMVPLAARPRPAPAAAVPRVADAPAAAEERSAERPVDPIPNASTAEHRAEPRPRPLREAIAARQAAAQAAQAPQAAPAGPSSAREACGSRVLIALWNCMQRECRNPRFAQQPACVKINEERRARELQ